MLHVLNGDGAAETFAAERPAAEPRLVWRDILMDGPLGDEPRRDGLDRSCPCSTRMRRACRSCRPRSARASGASGRAAAG